MASCVDKQLLKVGKVFIHESTPEANEDIHFPGTLYLLEKPEGHYLEWMANISDSPENKNSMKSIRTSTIELSKSRRFVVSFALQELKSIRKNKPTLGWSRLIFILRCGTTCPALHFHDGGSNLVLNELQKYLNISKSTHDPNLFVVIELQDKDSQQPKLPSKTFSELNLFGPDQLGDPWMNIVNDSYSVAFNGFSKVTKFFHDNFLPVTEPFSQLEVAYEAAPDSGDLTINTDSESGFALITPCKKDLPARPSIDRTPLLSARIWSSFMDSSGKITDVEEVKKAIFRGGVDPSIRQEVWKFLLGYYKWDSTYQNRVDERRRKIDDYFRMKLQWKSFTTEQESRFTELREQKNLIEKDVLRTDRCHKFYQGESNSNLAILNDILLTHCMYDFDLGYVQGMSDLLSPILVVMEHEVDAFWCFAGFIKMLSKNFEKDQQATKNQLLQLKTLLSFVDPELTLYLEKNDSLNMFFCFRWLLILFKREFNFPETMMLWEVLWTGLPCKNFHLLICLAILDVSKSVIMENNFGFSEILKYINDLPGRLKVDEILKISEGIFVQLRDCKYSSDVIKKILGLGEFASDVASSPFDPFHPFESRSQLKKCSLNGGNDSNSTSHARQTIPLSPVPTCTVPSSGSVMSSFDNIEELGLSFSQATSSSSLNNLQVKSEQKS